MNDVLTGLLLLQSRRERILLGLLVGVVLPLAIVFLWIIPQFEKQNVARQQVIAAQTLQIWVEQRAIEFVEMKEGLPQSAVNPNLAIGISGIEDTLRDANLRNEVSRLSNRDGGGIELAFDQVEFKAMADWLDNNAESWGYEIRNFRFEKLDRVGLVAAEFLLEPKQ